MNKLSKIFLGISISFLVIIFILSYVLIKKSNEFDTSFMREVTVNEVLTLFESDNYHVIYVGRKTCPLCEKFLPNLKMQVLNITLHLYI